MIPEAPEINIEDTTVEEAKALTPIKEAVIEIRPLSDQSVAKKSDQVKEVKFEDVVQKKATDVKINNDDQQLLMPKPSSIQRKHNMPPTRKISSRRSMASRASSHV